MATGMMPATAWPPDGLAIERRAGVLTGAAGAEPHPRAESASVSRQPTTALSRAEWFIDQTSCLQLPLRLFELAASPPRRPPGPATRCSAARLVQFASVLECQDTRKAA